MIKPYRSGTSGAFHGCERLSRAASLAVSQLSMRSTQCPIAAEAGALRRLRCRLPSITRISFPKGLPALSTPSIWAGSMHGFERRRSAALSCQTRRCQIAAPDSAILDLCAGKSQGTAHRAANSAAPARPRIACPGSPPGIALRDLGMLKLVDGQIFVMAIIAAVLPETTAVSGRPHQLRQSGFTRFGVRLCPTLRARDAIGRSMRSMV